MGESKPNFFKWFSSVLKDLFKFIEENKDKEPPEQDRPDAKDQPQEEIVAEEPKPYKHVYKKELWLPFATLGPEVVVKDEYKTPTGMPIGAVVHFTAGWNLIGNAIKSLARTKYGFHCIDIVQGWFQPKNMPLNIWGNHAGTSKSELVGYGKTSSNSNKLLGIEMNCGGKLSAGNPRKKDRNGKPQDPNKWYTWFNKEVPHENVRILKKTTIFGGPKGAYEKYSEKQEKDLEDGLVWLCLNDENFRWENIVGHHEIAGMRWLGRWRKNDPGGSLSMDMQTFRHKIRDRVQRVLDGLEDAPFLSDDTPETKPKKEDCTMKAKMLDKNSSKVLQEALNRAGAKLKVDGIVGPKTMAALYAYQKRAGLDKSDYICDVVEKLQIPISIKLSSPKIPKKKKVSKVKSGDVANLRILKVAAKEIGQKEIPGKAENKRIWTYQAYATKDNKKGWSEDVPWCSTFACFVVEMAGLKSTNSASARSWERAKFTNVTDSALPGDVVVFYRKGIKSGYGHVGFLVKETSSYYYVLGGNQSNGVNVRKYSKSKTTGKSGKGPIGVFRPHKESISKEDAKVLKSIGDHLAKGNTGIGGSVV